VKPRVMFTVGALALAALLPTTSFAQAVETIMSDTWYIHTDVADQVDLEELRQYLRDGDRLLQGSQNGGDVACCHRVTAASLIVIGSPGDGGDVLDASLKWSLLPTGRNIVQTISWCGTTGVFFGCASVPGSKLAVSLDASPMVLGKIMAHERGHNAGLNHRSGSCNLMNSAVGNRNNGCLIVSECNAFKSGGFPQGALCPCIGPNVGDPPILSGEACVYEGAGICLSDGRCPTIPGNDTCEAATVIADGDHKQSNDGASLDESISSCQVGPIGDIWFDYAATCTGDVFLETCDSTFNTYLSTHTGCNTGSGGALVCADDCPVSEQPADCYDAAACFSEPVVYGDRRLIRSTGRGGDIGGLALDVSCVPNGVTDTDSDSLSDQDEVDSAGSDPRDPDTDDDGLEDGDEYWVHLTDPTSADTDGDTLGDLEEALLSPTSPLLADSDGDGFFDPDDDFDGDGLSNAVELHLTGTDPNDADSDGDGFADGSDNCLREFNPTQHDSDGDGRGSICDASAPLILSDGSPRVVDVEIELSADPGRVGQAFGATVPAWLSAAGTISVNGPIVEPVIADVVRPVVPGTASDYELALDSGTGAFTSATWSADAGAYLLDQVASSATVGGFEYGMLSGETQLRPLYCTSGGSCELVPGQTFDAATGTARAIGPVNVSTGGALMALMGDVRVSQASQYAVAFVSFSPASGVLGPPATSQARVNLGAAVGPYASTCDGEKALDGQPGVRVNYATREVEVVPMGPSLASQSCTPDPGAKDGLLVIVQALSAGTWRFFSGPLGFDYTFDVSPDEDADGVLDPGDNCPYVANPGQENTDALAAGDACQCGDVDLDGDVDADDATALSRRLAGLPSTVWDYKCSLGSDPLGCGLTESILMRRVAAGLPADTHDLCQLYLFFQR